MEDDVWIVIPTANNRKFYNYRSAVCRDFAMQSYRNRYTNNLISMFVCMANPLTRRGVHTEVLHDDEIR